MIPKGYWVMIGLAMIPALFIATLNQPPEVKSSLPAFSIFALVVAAPIFVLRPLWLVVRQHPSPIAQLRQDLKERWPWMLTTAIATVSLGLTLRTASGVKKTIPDVVGFHADAALVDLDRLLFFGHDAWELSHYLFGSFTFEIDAAYQLWHLFHTIFLVAACLVMNRRIQMQLVLAYQLTWLVLGNGVAMLFASVGPCFLERFTGDARYAPLMDKLASEGGAESSLSSMNYLLESPYGFGAGISAMPSMHVAVAVLFAMTFRSYLPRFQWIAWLYAAIIYVGSIHLGWHYATDGLVSLVGVISIWKLVGYVLDKRPQLRGCGAVGGVNAASYGQKPL